jgi:predicted DNA-binding transcriptional regulator AlpA
MSVIPTVRPETCRHRTFLSVAASAALLGLSEMTLYRAMKVDQLPAIRIRGRLIVPGLAIDELVAAAVKDCAPPEACQHEAFYKVVQAAALFGMSEMTLYRAIAGDQFPAIRLRGRLIVPGLAIDEMVAEAMAERAVADAAAWVRDPGAAAKPAGGQAMRVAGLGGGL